MKIKNCDITINVNYFIYAYFINVFMKKIGLEKAHFIGHSMGGGIVSSIAVYYPKNILSIILLNSTGIPISNITALIKIRLKETVKQIKISNYAVQNLHFITSFIFTIFRNILPNIKLAKMLVYQDLRKILPKIKTPCLLIFVKQDCLIPLNHCMQFYNLIPNSKLIILNNYFHEWCLIESQKFAKIINFFYKNL